MDALRSTLALHSLKTRQFVYQYPDGTFPAAGAVLNVSDTRGHTDWTRDINADSITLVNSISGDGVLTYGDAGDLLLNGVPVGGGGGTVVGGTNISVAGSTVNLDPTKDGGINMLTGTLGFNAGGKDSTIVFNTSTTNGTLTVTNTTGTPRVGTSTGVGGPSITLSSENTINTNTIAMVGSGATSTSAISITDGVVNSAVSYTGSNQKLSVSCNKNVALFANDATHAIEMGSTLGGIFVTTQDQSINLRRLDASGANTESLFVMEGANTVRIGNVDVIGNPTLRFQTSLANADITMNSASCLVISGSSGVTTQIATPLVDVSSGAAGVAGQVLTSAGAGAPPYWATPNSMLIYTITDYTADISLNIPDATTLRIRVFTQAAGGGGGGGIRSTSDYGGGGGGAGFTSDYIFDVPNGTIFTVENGTPGLFGSLGYDGGDATNSSITATIDGELLQYETRGGKGGKAGNPDSGGPGTGSPGAGGDGNPVGDSGSGAQGGKGGGFYGGSGNNRDGGRGIGSGVYSGAGGGGGYVETNPDTREAGGNGARGFTRIEILESF